jgi:predicted Ser/Thr protein kinase
MRSALTREVVVAAAASLLLGGCSNADADAVALRQWSLSSATGAEAHVQLPAHVGDVVCAPPCRYALRASILVPPSARGKPFTLAIPRLAARAALRVDGETVPTLGMADEPSYLDDRSVAWQISPRQSERGELHLELTIDHRWVRSGWLDTVPRLSATSGGDRWFRFVRAADDWTAILSLFAVSLVAFSCAVAFGLDRRRKAEAWYVLSCVASIPYCAQTAGLLAPIAGDASVGLMALGLGASAYAHVRYRHLKGAMAPPSWTWTAALALLTLIALVASSPSRAVVWLIPPLVLLMSATAMTSLVIMTGRTRNAFESRSELLLITIAWPLAVTAGTNDFTAWLGLGDHLGGLRLGCVGVTVVTLLKWSALIRELIASSARTAALNAQLAERVRMLESSNQEVNVLNHELRRQIGARSRTLADALATMGDVDAPTFHGAPGELVADRYRIVRQLGAGGMGTVFEVTRATDGRRFALKVLHGAKRGAELSRFAREAQIVAEIDHPNIVSVADVDVATSGLLFIVMELVSGRCLDEWSHRHRDTAWALRMLSQIAAGLSAIHLRGIVHRDLKPSNILVVDDGERIKIVDFGVSAVSQDPSVRPPALVAGAVALADTLAQVKSLTRTGAIVGTPLYMAPEVASGRSRATASSDVYAFGLIAFELITGRRALDEAAVMIALRGGIPPRPSFQEASDALDPTIRAVFDRCVSIEPRERPDARSVAALLEERVRRARESPIIAARPGERAPET